MRSRHLSTILPFLVAGGFLRLQPEGHQMTATKRSPDAAEMLRDDRNTP
jgi:hypothetical protein